MNLADERRNYARGELRRADLKADPIEFFESWIHEAKESGAAHEANAMVLATVDSSGAPLQRTVLLKGLSAEGFVFFTNYSSRKAQHISANTQVCLLFPWIELERQVIVRGVVEKVSREESTAYFQTRPRESQIGAWVSDQSAEIKSRDELEQSIADLEEKFANQDVPLPEFWGGYRVKPVTIEFWQGGPGRVHDRFEYRKTRDEWEIIRLSP